MPRASAAARRTMLARRAEGLVAVSTMVEVVPAITDTGLDAVPATGTSSMPVAVGVSSGPHPVGPVAAHVRAVHGRDAGSGRRRGRSRAKGPAASTKIRPVSVVDVDGDLPRLDPPRLVRDGAGLVSIDVPYGRYACGRRRSDVGVVAGLPHLGAPLLAAAFHLWGTKAASTMLKGGDVLRALAADIADAELAGTAVADLPADLVDRLVVVRERRLGRRLNHSGRAAMNCVRTLLRFVPGTAHIDLEHRDNPVDPPAQWTLDEAGAPVASPKLALTDVDVELIAKRSSLEYLRMVARWNQFAAYANGDAAAAGPCSTDELEAAAALREVHPTRAFYWNRLWKRGSPEWWRLLRVGWDEMGRLDAEFGAAVADRLPKATVASLLRRRRHLEAGGTLETFVGVKKLGCMSMVAEGWAVAVRLAYPTSHDAIAPMALLGLQTRFNPGVLAGLAEDFLQPRVQHWIENEAGEPEAQAAEGPTRLYGAPYKPRAHRLQPVDFPMTDRPEAPGSVSRFVRGWTAGLRDDPGIEVAGRRLFVFTSVRVFGEGAVLSFDSSDGHILRGEFAALCRRAGASPLTPKALRVMGVDIIHDRSGGDEMLIRAAGGWVPGSTAPRLYLEGPALGRDRERLFWAGLLVARDRDHGIGAGGRPSTADVFAATDGFRCRQPGASPDPVGPGELCRSRGLCAICPHGSLDVASPAWSFARLVALAREIGARMPAATARWRRRYRPVLAELIDVWLPLFPDEVVAAARRLPDYPVGDLPDLPEGPTDAD